MDKIQLANNLLFSSTKTEDHSMDNLESNQSRLQSRQRVTFSSDIEEYEDNFSDLDDDSMQYKDEETIDNEVTEIIERSENALNSNRNFDMDEMDGFMNNMSIDEVYSSEANSDSDVDDDDDNEYATEIEINSERQQNNGSNQTNSDDDRNDDHSYRKQNSSPKNQMNLMSRTTNEQNHKIEQTNTKCFSSIHSAQRIAKQAKNTTKSNVQRIVSDNFIKCDSNKEPEILKIHLNVKSCCEHKYLENCRLPRYNGYISQYGLSKDQLELRELNRQRYQEKRMRKQRDIMIAKQQIADLNEQAFKQWLIRKDRNAKPKCKNMYDMFTRNKSNS